MNRIARLSLLASTVLIGACSVLEPDRIDYKSATRGNPLEVPPDLTQLSRDSRYVVPGGPVTASGMAPITRSAAGAPMVPNQIADVRFERAEGQRRLVVQRPPEKLWDTVREFWLENGFLLTQDDPTLGILDTDWAENRAKLPQDFIRRNLGRLLDTLYDTGERDRFRTRLERRGDATEITITHRGMVEVYTTAQRDQTVWQPRPADPELETEFLRRLMVRLGMPEEQARAQVAASPAPAPRAPSARVDTADGRPVLVIDEAFDRAWRRVGLALDRTGFTVEDRDRNQGIYFVRYVDTTVQRSEPGFFGRLLGRSEPKIEPMKLQLALRADGDRTVLRVLNASGQPETSGNAQRIVQVLADELR